MLPDDIKNPPKTMAKGESIFKNKGNLVTFVYKDIRYVRILTNLQCNSKDFNSKPVALKDYNKWSKGIDLSNQLLNYYTGEKKCHPKIF